MNLIAKKLLQAAQVAMPMTAPQRELIVVPQPEPTLGELADKINADYADLNGATLSAVEKAMSIGKTLQQAKRRLNHGKFADYVTANFPFAMRWAQQCMRLANHEAEIRQRLEELRAIGSHLSLAEAFRLIGSLNPKPKLKRKKAKQPDEARG